MSLRSRLFVVVLISTTVINLKTNASEVIESSAPQVNVQIANERLRFTVENYTFEFDNRPPNAEADRNYQALTITEREAFFDKRSYILTTAAKVLSKVKLGFGVGTLLNERIRFQVRKYQLDWSLRMIQEMPDQLSFGEQQILRARYMRDLDEHARETEQKAQITLKEKSFEMVGVVLKALDQRIWSQPQLVSNSNEFGVVFSIGAVAVAGVNTGTRTHGIGGLFDIGISLGINKETGQVAFQVFRDFEKLESAIGPVIGTVGVIGKLGLFISNESSSSIRQPGSSLYPVAIPGYTYQNPTMYSVGLSSGLTLPPPPIADIMGYTTQVNSRTLWRIKTSKLFNGFARTENNLATRSINYISTRVSSAIRSITQIFETRQKNQAASCQIIF